MTSSTTSARSVAVGPAPARATVLLAANPSHLEAVDPVVEGITRAEQTDRSSREGVHDPAVALPVLIHGDASFPGQGVVAETLNLQRLIGYTTGGTIHLIANNQVGFTTDPADGRSTRYSSDLAKGFDVPIIHVNADDPEGAISAIRLALAFRRRFGSDVVVDLVGYRRHGHNEGDEPSFTQPLMAERIANKPSVRTLYAQQLANAGEIPPEEAERFAKEMDRMRAAHETLKTSLSAPRQSGEGTPVSAEASVDTGVPEEQLRELSAELVRVPEGFTVNPKLVKMLERRIEALDAGGIDWGQAESLAFASLLVEGIPIRLTGQDTERGTFSHRHLVLHDAHTGAQHAPIKHLSDAAASFEAYNSPLSEYAALGFEYGYSVTAPGGARPLGGPVRRLHQRRADRRRPVPRLRPRQVAPDVAPDAAAPARLRRQRPRSTRARGSSGSSSSPPRRTSGSSTRRRRRSTSTSSAGRRSTRTRARSS